MPVSDPFGPSVYVPDLNTGAGAASQGWAAGISNLGKALFPDPSAVADARYKNTQTQLLNTQATARSNLAKIFADPNAAADPNNRAQIYSWMTTLPADEQNAWHQNLAGVIQNVPGMTQAQRDQYNAGAGMVPAGNTPSGYNAGLQNQVNVATIGANAQRDVANINQGGDTFRWYYTPGAATSPGGPGMPPAGPIVAPQGAITGAPRPGGGAPGTVPGYMPQYQNPADTATVLGGRGAQQGQPGQVVTSQNPPSHGVSPPPVATQPQPQTTTTPPPTDANTPAGAASTALTGAAQKGQLPTNQAKESLDLAVDRKAAEIYGQPGVVFGSNKADVADPNRYRLSPDLQAQVTNRANQLMLSPATKGTFASVDAAVNQAWNDIIEPKRANGELDTTRHLWGGGRPEIYETSKGPTPVAPAATPAPTTPPPATPLAPAAPVPAAAPAPTPLLATGKQAIPAPPPAPPAVRYTGPPKPPKTPPAQTAAPATGGPSGAIQPGAVWGNRVFSGGDPNSATAWVPATAAQIATAKKQGNYRP